MKKILFLIFISLCLSTVGFGQKDTIIIRDGFVVEPTPKFVLKIKKYSLTLETSENDSIQTIINPNWIKSITVIKDKAALEIFKTENPVILINLKRRSWKQLPKELQERFENASSE